MRLDVKTDCRFFKGGIPCEFHKSEGAVCKDCKNYTQTGKRILIIKLASIGDVIRTTPIVRKLKDYFKNCEITWISCTPEILPEIVDIKLNFEIENIFRLQADHFDILYNLDKDKGACALANLVSADLKKGFSLYKGKCNPIDKDAENKFLKGIDDNSNKDNKLSYQEEVFEIAGLPYNKERYLLDKSKKIIRIPDVRRPVIGLNTGCGHRWKTRLWPEENWVELAKMLIDKGLSVVLLGGEQEDERNKRIAKMSKAKYLEVFPLTDFLALINQCDLIVTSVTMAFHVAIAFEKKVVLFNNVFNRNEFELYGLGELIEPDVDCLGCFKGECEKECMEHITPKKVFDVVVGLSDGG